MIVTLDVFSGRPNPTWQLSEKQANQLFERVTDRALIDSQAVDGVLGYRGLVISAHGDDQLPEGAPATFRIGGQLPTEYAAPESEARALSAEEVDDATDWLLATGEHAVDEHVMSVVKDLIHLKRAQLDAGEPAAARVEEDLEKALGATTRACIIANTPYNPGFWNTPTVQPKNNCYNYSMNYRSDTFAQPGRISGHPNSTMDCAHVAAAANWDGCTAVCNGSNKNVALVIWPGVDYHWYRRHSNGFWGHKPGGTAARNTDNSGRVINGTTLTPANCNRGPYTVFCGYRFSPSGMRVR